jgi:hypothetical protein
MFNACLKIRTKIVSYWTIQDTLHLLMHEYAPVHTYMTKNLDVNYTLPTATSFLLSISIILYTEVFSILSLSIKMCHRGRDRMVVVSSNSAQATCT